MTITTITLPCFNDSRIATNIRSDPFHRCRIRYNELLLGEVSGSEGIDSFFREEDGTSFGFLFLPMFQQCKLEIEHDGEEFNLKYDIVVPNYDRREFVINNKIGVFRYDSLGLYVVQ